MQVLGHDGVRQGDQAARIVEPARGVGDAAGRQQARLHGRQLAAQALVRRKVDALLAHEAPQALQRAVLARLAPGVGHEPNAVVGEHRRERGLLALVAVDDACVPTGRALCDALDHLGHRHAAQRLALPAAHLEHHQLARWRARASEVGERVAA